jgi:hypothetical protein
MASQVAYQPQLGYLHYIKLIRSTAIDLEALAAAAAGTGAQLSTWFDPAGAVSGSAKVECDATNSTFEIRLNSATLAPTTAELQSNVAKLTFAAATGVAVGDVIKVASLPSPFAGLNTTSAVVTAVTTTPSHTISYALAGTSISSASVSAGAVTTGLYPLDGSGKAIRLLNITSLNVNPSTNKDTIITHDQETLGSSISMPLSDTTTIPFTGSTIIKNVDHKFLQIMRMHGTSQQLAAKYLRIGPVGSSEKLACYGKIDSIQEAGDAGTRRTYSATLTTDGPAYTIFDNS